MGSWYELEREEGLFLYEFKNGGGVWVGEGGRWEMEKWKRGEGRGGNIEILMIFRNRFMNFLSQS